MHSIRKAMLLLVALFNGLKGSVMQQLAVPGMGAPFTVTLDARKDPSLRIKRDGKTIWEDVKRSWKPWKLALADVDGDGRTEILVGLLKATKYLPKPHTCLFVYGFNGKAGYPLWRGSSMGRPLLDFALHKFPGQAAATLITVERRLDGRKAVAAWSWNRFGFTQLWDRGSWKSVRLTGFAADTIGVLADGKATSLKWTTP